MTQRTRIRPDWRALCPWVLVLATHASAQVTTRLPSNTGLLYVGDAAPLQQSRRVCRYVANVSATLDVSGLIEGRQVRRSLSIYYYSDVMVRVESAGDSARPPFVLWADPEPAPSRLYFPQSAELIESLTSAPLMQAVLGIPLTARDLGQLMMGCPSWDVQWGDVWEPRNRWLRIFHELDQLYLHRASDQRPWQLVAVDHRLVKSPFGWRAMFLHQRVDNTPRQVRLTSLEWNGVEAARFDVRIVLRDVELRPTRQPADKSLRSAASAASRTALQDGGHEWPLIAASAFPRGGQPR